MKDVASLDLLKISARQGFDGLTRAELISNRQMLVNKRRELADVEEGMDRIGHLYQMELTQQVIDRIVLTRLGDEARYSDSAGPIR